MQENTTGTTNYVTDPFLLKSIIASLEANPDSIDYDTKLIIGNQMIDAALADEITEQQLENLYSLMTVGASNIPKPD